MAAVDFPSSPTVGQTFTSGGVVWMWDGVKWTSTGAATGLYLPITGGTLTGDLILNRDAQVALGAATKEQVDAKLSLAGVTNGSDASAGQIGEVISSFVPSPGTAITSTVAKNITTLPLTAGDWDVQGEIGFLPSAVALTSIVAAISTTNGGTDPMGVGVSRNTTSGSTLGACIFPLRPCRVSLSAPATYYLVTSVALASGTCTAYGNIWARRAR